MILEMFLGIQDTQDTSYLRLCSDSALRSRCCQLVLPPTGVGTPLPPCIPFFIRAGSVYSSCSILFSFMQLFSKSCLILKLSFDKFFFARYACFFWDEHPDRYGLLSIPHFPELILVILLCPLLETLL